MKLTGRERLELTNALLDAYPDQGDFDMLLQVNFNRSLNTFVDIHQDYKKVIFNLISRTQAEGWTNTLIIAAYETNSGNQMLQECYRKYILEQAEQIPKQNSSIERKDLESKQANGYESIGGRHNHVETTISPQQDLNPTHVPSISIQVSSADDFLRQARHDIEQAQRCVQTAFAPLNERKSFIPSHFRKAKEELEKANVYMDHLHRLLDETSPLPEPIVSKHHSIINLINIVSEQIENHLIPYLDRDIWGNHALLISILEQIDTLIPKKEPVMSSTHSDLRNKGFDVFLCHNNKDKEEVKEIAKKLQEEGIIPWLDEWELQPGLPWQRTLEQQISEIKSAAVFVGASGIGPWQNMEIEALLREFVNRGCPVIPLLLKTAPDKPKLPLFLAGMTWVDFHKLEPDPMKQLIWGITSKKPDVHDSQDRYRQPSPAQALSTPKTLSFPKKAELVNKLLACSCVRNRDSRETVLSLLNEQFPGIADAISRRTESQADVMEIISTCLNHPNSLQELVGIVIYFEGESSINTQQLRAFLQSNSI